MAPSLLAALLSFLFAIAPANARSLTMDEAGTCNNADATLVGKRSYGFGAIEWAFRGVPLTVGSFDNANLQVSFEQTLDRSQAERYGVPIPPNQIETLREIIFSTDTTLYSANPREVLVRDRVTCHYIIVQYWQDDDLE